MSLDAYKSTKEQLLSIFLEQDPTARSPYGLYGHPPMWAVGYDSEKELSLYARPTRTQEQIGHQWIEADGVSVQWRDDRNGVWVGQGLSMTYEDFHTKFAEFLPLAVYHAHDASLKI